MYDQHSSEEELEVINGPSAVAAAEAAAAAAAALTATNAGGGPGASSSSVSRLSNRGCSSSLDTEAPYDERATTSNSKRSSSTLMVENRKRSLAHSSDDEVCKE